MLGKVLGALAQTLVLRRALLPLQKSGNIYFGWESRKLSIFFPRDKSHEIIQIIGLVWFTLKTKNKSCN